MANKMLVTGGAGFIGSEFVRQNGKRKNKIIVVDKLTYAGDRARLKEAEGKFKFYKTDISNKVRLREVFRKERPDCVVHFAAETHVDRSIHLPLLPFIETNVKGTENLIELSREFKVKRFIHISTDEVYGQIRRGKFYEHSPLQPRNPYSATKAAADHLIRAAIETYDFPGIIVRPSNNYGHWQYPEKLVPVIILKALHNRRVPVYGKGVNVREWLHVSDSASAIALIMRKGKIGEIYNIGSDAEKKNIVTVKKILKLLNKPSSLVQYVKDRPGHDIRYSVSFGKVKKLGWKPKMSYERGMRLTVEWNMHNLKWLENKLNYLASYWKKVYKTK